jgi:pyridoxal phosphate enzyme (YggS family)
VESGVSVPDRRRELAANLATVRDRIAVACEAADRPAGAVELIAITKTFPASDVVTLTELGITEVGESRDQEAVAKVREVAELAELARVAASLPAGVPPLPHWHFVGALQTNKCASVVSYASLVHSVDRLRLVAALGRAAGQQPVRCLVQVDLDETSRPGRAGARPDDVNAIAAAIAAHAGLELAGVMAVAPLRAEPGRAFATLAEIADAVRQRHPSATVISAGMSGDLEAAVANGATHLRVGSALLGSRRHPVG